MAQGIIISIITTVSAYIALTLLPLWIGMAAQHPRLRRLALVPSIPFVLFGIVFNVIIALLLTRVSIPPTLISIAYSTGFSALSLWLITWALFRKWRQQ